ncbi:hypothetical protein [Arcticibacter svalbardensis]|uniref:hypothetical protein n=1 Tax=Arcticibacter svalbardensis TaxID=1288027 RepID=UPI00068FD5F8|nr:hypothetical protein [Arcticibacter svalbardensis]
MINVTVRPIIDPKLMPLKYADKLMNEKLIGLAVGLQSYLHKTFTNEKYDDVVIYLSYNTKRVVQWKVVNDVPKQIHVEVAKCCGRLGYVQWKELEL